MAPITYKGNFVGLLTVLRAAMLDIEQAQDLLVKTDCGMQVSDEENGEENKK